MKQMKPENCELEKTSILIEKSASMAKAIIKTSLSCVIKTKGKKIYAITNYKVDILTIVGTIREL